MDEFQRKDKEIIIDTHLSFCKSRYQETGNPLYVWLAITFAKNDTRLMKPWINKYLAETAENLIRIENPKKQVPNLIKNALGFKSGRSFFQFHSSWGKADVHDDLNGLRKNLIKKKDHSIYKEVAELYGITDDTVKKWDLQEKKWKEQIINEGEKEQFKKKRPNTRAKRRNKIK